MPLRQSRGQTLHFALLAIKRIAIIFHYLHIKQDFHYISLSGQPFYLTLSTVNRTAILSHYLQANMTVILSHFLEYYSLYISLSRSQHDSHYKKNVVTTSIKQH